MKIKEFVEKYQNVATDRLKESFVKDNLEFKEYIPFTIKDALATEIVKRSFFKYESVTDESGDVTQKLGNTIQVNSVSQYLFFCGVVVQQYTNLEVDLSEFYSDYDLLAQTGLLSVIMKLIPQDELNEFKMLCDMKKNDYVTNYYEIHGFISNQVERFGNLVGVSLKPLLNKIIDGVNNMDDEKIKKISNILDTKIVKFLKK